MHLYIYIIKYIWYMIYGFRKIRVSPKHPSDWTHPRIEAIVTDDSRLQPTVLHVQLLPRFSLWVQLCSQLSQLCCAAVHFRLVLPDHWGPNGPKNVGKTKAINHLGMLSTTHLWWFWGYDWVYMTTLGEGKIWRKGWLLPSNSWGFPVSFPYI